MLLLAGGVAFPQAAKKKRTREISCHDLFIESSRALPVLYARGDYDSIRYYVGRREHCGPMADASAIKILLAIQQGRFTDDLLSEALYYDLPDEYAAAVSEYQKGRSRLGYRSTRAFDATPYDRAIFAVTTAWAKRLLDEGRRDSVEAFLCRVFAGDIRRPVAAIKADKVKYAVADSLRAKVAVERRNGKAIDGSLGMGLWTPGGNLSALGAHPSLDVAVGFRNKLNQLDWVISARFLHSKTGYTVFRDNTLFGRTYYFGGYIGIDYTRYITHSYHFESGLIAGAGLDGFDIAQHSRSYHANDYMSPLSINSFNGNVGLRCNYFFNPGLCLGLAAKYNFINYCNPGGTPLDGHAMSVVVYVGLNGPKR